MTGRRICVCSENCATYADGWLRFVLDTISFRSRQTILLSTVVYLHNSSVHLLLTQPESKIYFWKRKTVGKPHKIRFENY